MVEVVVMMAVVWAVVMITNSVLVIIESRIVWTMRTKSDAFVNVCLGIHRDLMATIGRGRSWMRTRGTYRQTDRQTGSETESDRDTERRIARG